MPAAMLSKVISDFSGSRAQRASSAESEDCGDDGAGWSQGGRLLLWIAVGCCQREEPELISKVGLLFWKASAARLLMRLSAHFLSVIPRMGIGAMPSCAAGCPFQAGLLSGSPAEVGGVGAGGVMRSALRCCIGDGHWGELGEGLRDDARRQELGKYAEESS